MASPALALPLFRPQMAKRSVLSSLCSRLRFQPDHAQSRYFHRLPSGLEMEIIFQKGCVKTSGLAMAKPPLVFVHGLKMNLLPRFDDSFIGYLLFARHVFCLLSDTPSGKVAGTLQTDASDIADFIHKELELTPILIGHSFGGLIVQFYIPNMVTQSYSDAEETHTVLAGAVLICSVPPSGNGYQELMKESSRLPLFDLRKLNASLPPPSVPKDLIPILVVLGASDDFIVDSEDLNETAKFYGVSPDCREGIAYDMMLDLSSERGVRFLLSWMENLSHQTVS